MDSRIKFRHLQVLIEVARHKSVGKAAEALHVTQPAVTRTMRELEDILETALVEKDGRGIRLSHAGEIFLRHAGESIASVRRGLDSISRALKEEGPPVRVGALPTVSAAVMPGVAADFLALKTGSRLTVVTGENRWLLGELRTGGLDLVVGRMAAPEMMAGLTFEPLYNEEVAFVVASDHPLAAGHNFSLSELANYPVLMPTPGSVIRPYVDRLLLTNGISAFPEMIETVSDSFGRAFVTSHRAVWIISRGVVASELAAGRFRALDLDMAETRGAVGLTRLAGAEPSSSLSLLMQTIRDRVSRRGSSFD
ncbi:MAG TPA: pca operon transcription factor PcaQ [Ensifer sp.]|nr:pca operon transcription factor PcaQ [Ensifer sp.]